MTLVKAARTLLLITTACLCMANSECDPRVTCNGACSHLARCENEWLEADGKPPMDADAYTDYLHACDAHCKAVGSYDDLECIEEESCDRLKDGKCSE